MKRLAFLAAIAVIAAVFVRLFVFEGIYVASGSMEPTLPVGTNLFLEKISYHFRPPRRGEVVVFPLPFKGEKDLIKRVIALPGETIEIRDKAVYINGNLIKEEYVKFTRKNEALEGDNIGPLKVPKKNIFVMGDNRDESNDSRDWKDPETGEHRYFIPVRSIKGRLIILYK